MANDQIKQRQAWRRTDDYTPGTPKLKLVIEDLPLPLDPTAALIKVHAVSLNYRDANISNGGNPWPVTPNGIICNDAAGEIIAVGDKVKRFKVGDRVAPTIDTAYITHRSTGRSWLAANEDGVLATYIVYDEEVLGKLPTYLSWECACLIPCAGVTAWAALRDVGIGKSVLIQGTGGVSHWALKLARAAGLKVVLTSSDDNKLSKLKKHFGAPEILTINYSKTPEWHEEVLRLTDGIGVDLVLEMGGSSSLVKSLRCTRRGGIVSQVGYLGRQKPEDLHELVPTIIDRRVILRGINAGPVSDMEDLCAALEATQMNLDDIIDKVYPFDQAEEALQSLWEGKVIGKLVLRL
ncbi:Zinc-type alcohol dehydrogenase-like protein [Exophiala dermatitidis]|uniref:Alcohol dehydrogenase n=1 Tax=Exophiala dermatitidis (strain ATCC 34100 / CBS 525.76 / NIH/UT8656) TaxID=858893 RepID=H6BKJ9_EXODN|nr:alcohol dehydrogenase [Exophiala dermatitidis NIH/UT8656]EHY52633.1 alcohol dehydrogenase [Exophiala dermatitidis NIH/UT8656]